MNEVIKVMIVGGLHHNTLGVIRSIGESGVSRENIKVVIVEKNYKKWNIISTSKYINVKNIYYVDNNEDCISVLLDNTDETRQTIICCSDGTAEVVIAHQKELCMWYNLPSTVLNVQEYMSKEAQCNLALECGFVLPKSKVISKNETIQWKTFPCITKPIKSAFGGGKSDIKISNNLAELTSAIRDTTSETVQIQDFINKKIEFQLIGCSLDAGETIIIPGYTTIIRQPENTNTGYLKYSPIGELAFDLNAARNFLRRLGYSGLFSLEFIRDNHNVDYFLEINMRNDGNAYCVNTAGVNLPYIWVYYQTFHKLPDCNMSFERPVYFMPDWNDVRRGIMAVGFFGWIKEFLRAESHAVYNKNDMKPFIAQSLGMVGISFRYVKSKLLK